MSEIEFLVSGEKNRSQVIGRFIEELFPASMVMTEVAQSPTAQQGQTPDLPALRRQLQEVIGDHTNTMQQLIGTSNQGLERALPILQLIANYGQAHAAQLDATNPLTRPQFLMNLAYAQVRTGRFQAAADNYQTAIVRLEELYGMPNNNNNAEIRDALRLAYNNYITALSALPRTDARTFQIQLAQDRLRVLNMQQ